MSTTSANAAESPDIQHPLRSTPRARSVEFHVCNPVRPADGQGPFRALCRHTLDVAQRSIELTIAADSLNTDNVRRNKHRAVRRHLRYRQPSAGSVRLSARHARKRPFGHARGPHASGKRIAIEFDGVIRPNGDELEVDVTTFADHRGLGMM